MSDELPDRVSDAGAPPSGRTPAGDAVTELVLATFPLHGRLLEVGERLTKPVGLTTARWQVLGAVLHEARTVSGIARVMGLTRQSVQRLADALAEDGLAEYRDNPEHRRAKLLIATPKGLDAVRGIHADQVAWANRVTEGLDAADLRAALATIEKLRAAVEADRDAR